MLCGYKDLLKALYDIYYTNIEQYSDVTSSHWREVGGHEASWDKGVLTLKGAGFGDRLGDDWLRWCYSLPQRFLLQSIISDYPNLKWIVEKAKYVAKRQGTIFSYDCLRQALSLALMSQSLNDILSAKGARICIIGDGYGYLASLFKTVFPNIQVVEVNLGKTLLFDAAYVQKVFPNEDVLLLQDKKDCVDAQSGSASFLFLEAEHYDWIEELKIDLFINIASMQEMNLSVVQNYLQFMRNSKGDGKYFYCCNRIEKHLPDGEVVRFSEYGWQEDDKIVFDELCPWYQKFPVPYPPFWKPFDGPIQHRLTQL